jgi:hypothetical protein
MFDPCCIEPFKNSIFMSSSPHGLALADVAPAKAERAKANGVRLDRQPTLPHHQQQEAIERPNAG